jgi:predicted nucleic acid-binding protein
MKELIEGVRRVSLEKARKLYLIDTCFLISAMKHPDKIKQLKNLKDICITSFNIEELLYVEERLQHDIRKQLRKFLKDAPFVILDVPVHPGNMKEERDFVNSIDEELLKNIRDPSDAVLMAVAIKTSSYVLTKDKHHLFTVVLENFLQNYGIKVYKDFNFLC